MVGNLKRDVEFPDSYFKNGQLMSNWVIQLYAADTEQRRNNLISCAGWAWSLFLIELSYKSFSAIQIVLILFC